MNQTIKFWQQLFTRKNLQLILVVAIIGFAYALSRFFSEMRDVPENTNKPVEIPVSVLELKTSSHQVKIATTGRITPRSTVNITPQVSGRISWLNKAMHAGGHFDKADVLFRIEVDDYQNALALEEAELARAKTELSLERAEADAAVAEWRELNGSKPAPELVSRTPQIAQAQAVLASAKARLNQARLSLGRTEYRLPFSGRVLASSLELGSFLQAGQNYGEVYNSDSLEVVISLPRSDVSWITTENHQIDILFEDHQTDAPQSTPGTLLRLGANLNNTTRFQEFIIKPVKSINLLPGTLSQVLITSSPLENTWKVPLSALQPDNFFWQVDENQRLKKIPIQIIAMQKDFIIVRAPMPAARIVDSPLPAGIVGAEVRILNTRSNNSEQSKSNTNLTSIPASINPNE